jgi:hypothetical protein
MFSNLADLSPWLHMSVTRTQHFALFLSESALCSRCHIGNLCDFPISIALLIGARSNILELVALTHAQFLIIFRELLNPSRKPSSSYQQRASEYITLLEAPHVICPLLVPPSCRTTAEPLALTFQSAYDADHVSPCFC